MVHLSTIGPVTIDLGTTRLSATSHQTCAALLYLIVERGKEIPRRTLLSLLFPDSTETAGAHALRQLVYRLRKLGVRIEGDGTMVMLARDAATWDVEVVDARGSCTEEELDLLGNGYLSAFAPSVSAPFEDWLDRHRTSASTQLRRGLLAQLRDEKAKHRFTAVDRIARACLALDPLNEEATLATAEVLVMSGSKAEALSVLDRYIDEVGGGTRASRSAPTRLRERIAEYVVDSGLIAEPPLLGRDGEIATLRALLSRVGRGGAEACVVWGASGIGKTRLLNETCAIAALEGLAVIRCGLQPHDQRRPLAILRDITPQLLDLPGALGCSPESLALMRGLCGRGEMPHRELPRTTQDSEIALAGVLAAATDLLGSVSAEQPLLVCIEDAHWLDPASLELIVEAVAGDRPVGILIASQRSLQLPNYLADVSRLSSIEILPLPKETAIHLLERLFERANRTVDREFIDWATALAGGVPFYLQSLFIQYASSGDRTAIPSTLTASLASKLERLTEPTRSVFDAIVVLGTLCTLGRLEAVVQLPRHSLIISLRDLEERGLIRSGPNAVTYAHELFAVTARSRMPETVSRMLHRSAASVLQAEAGPIDVTPWDIAEHMIASGESARAIKLTFACADEALALGRPQEAVELLGKAMAVSGVTGDRIECLSRTVKACQAAGEWRRTMSAAQELVNVTEQHGEPADPSVWLDWVESAHNAGQSQNVEGDGLLALARNKKMIAAERVRAAKHALFAAEDTNDSLLAKSALDSVSDIPSGESLMISMVYEATFGDRSKVKALARRVVTQAKALGQGDLSGLYNGAIALWRSGETADAIDAFVTTYAVAERRKCWSDCAACASMLSEIYWSENNLDKAKDWHDTAGTCLGRCSFPDRGASYYAIGVILALSAGLTDEAERLLKKADELYPRLRTGRMAVERLAYQVRVALARGLVPDADELDALLAGAGESRESGWRDIVTDTLVGALRRAGRSSEAADIKHRYLTIHRRDPRELPAGLRHLCGEESRN